ncbi:PREDICTED: uncharacterized protein LOC104818035 [Tarenaya hassleriana]|uniref:uncharacterized protein LOC104818035 n=1 Tax=Tarenaya hassleriana TaxID=28532 RepID=UPI00053C8EFA|nr:PREDICTED: uncharacterized protein LOC104818035 [Tarenaya hassleriana]
MASCSLGVPKIKIPAINISRGRSGNFLIPEHQRLWLGLKPFKDFGPRTTLQSVKTIQISAVPVTETAAFSTTANIDAVKDSEETKPSGLTSRLIPKPSEVEALVTEICDSTSIAEFELRLGGFRLYVARNLAEKSSPLPLPVPGAVTAGSTTEGLGTNGSASSPSLAITKAPSSSGGIEAVVDRAADEGLVTLRSPKVGFFRRSRAIKGKRTPPSCKEKDVVKEGQVLCYIEQLGGQIPIESDVSGEVVKILRDDGEPVGYNDALIKVLPSFPGIKKLQ